MSMPVILKQAYLRSPGRRDYAIMKTAQETIPKITIKKSPTADTRTCDVATVSKERLLESSKQHIGDVVKGMSYFMDLLAEASNKHDHTKLEHIDQFYEDFKSNFKTKDWFEMHKNTERHHLSAHGRVPDDVNLIDVIEGIVDGVMSGLARSGEYKHEQLPDDVLQKAYRNTVEMLLRDTKVV